MNKDINVVKECHCDVCHKRIAYGSWKAILSGALVALGLTFLFNLLTAGLGLSLFTENASDQKVLFFAGFAWMLVGGYIILFLAGWVTGRQICQDCPPCRGFVYGFITWTVYLIMSLLLVANVTEANNFVVLQNSFVTSLGQITLPTNTVNKVGLVTLSTFLLFFVGALGCSIGAYCGIKGCKKCNEKTLTSI